MQGMTRRSAVTAAAAVASTAVLGSVAEAQESAAAAPAPSDKLSARLTAVAPTWRTFNFPTAQAAVNFANTPPVQVAGQFCCTAKPNGTYDGFYFY